MITIKGQATSTSGPKYPRIRVKIIGEESSVENLLKICLSAMKKAKVPKKKQDEFEEEAKSGSYDDMLATIMRWFEVE